jgi:hypothetical protein
VVYPSLLRNLQAWLRQSSSENEDGFPKWEHPLQLGFSNTIQLDNEKSLDLYTFVRTSESPALAALLFKESESLLTMAVMLGQTEDLVWLKKTSANLRSLVQACWSEKNAQFQNRDRVNHTASKAVKVIRYRRNGTFPIDAEKSTSSFTVLNINFGNGPIHPVRVELVFSNRKKILLTEKDFEWSISHGTSVLDRPLRSLRRVTLTGLKRDESVVFSEPDYESFEPTMIIPFWAGAATPEQSNRFFSNHLGLYDSMGTPQNPLPAYLKVMLLECLNRNGLETEATRLFNNWYLEELLQERESATASVMPASNAYAHLEELIPLHTYLQLRGVSGWTQNQITIGNLNQNAGPITVQYGQTVLELGSENCTVKLKNSEIFSITQPGRYEILQA